MDTMISDTFILSYTHGDLREVSSWISVPDTTLADLITRGPRKHSEMPPRKFLLVPEALWQRVFALTASMRNTATREARQPRAAPLPDERWRRSFPSS